MIVMVRWTAFIVGLGGLYLTTKLSREGRFREAFHFLLFDALVVILFVLVHRIVDRLLDPPNNRGGGAWWL